MKLKIPEKQSDIKIYTYLEYEKFIKGLNDNQKKDEDYLLFNTLYIFYGIDNETYKKLPYNTTMELYEIVTTLLNTKQELVQRFKVKGIEFGLVPNMDDITLAELVDLDTTDIVRQLCILYRPITNKKKDKYLVELYKADLQYYDEFKELGLNIMNGFVGFFLNIQKDFMAYTLNSLEEVEGLNPRQKKDLEKSGSGILGFLNSVTGI